MFTPNVLLEISAARAEAAIALAILAALALALGGLWLTRIEHGSPAKAMPPPADPLLLPWWRDAGAEVPGDAAARAALAEALGARGDCDAAVVLAQGWREERDPDVRAAILAALRWCDGQTPSDVLREALASADESERVLAIEGLERRGDHDAIAPALDDASDVVALAAARALRAMGESDLLTAAREKRGAAFAELLELLG